MSKPIVIDVSPKQPRLRDSTSIPIEPAKLPTFFDKGWKQDRSFFCNECGNPSYEEEGGQRRRGCKICGYVTFYPSCHFTPQRNTGHS